MQLSIEEKVDFMKKAAFTADKSTCGYKIGCVGVNEYKAGKLNFLDEQIKQKGKFIYIKTWNETLPGEVYCQQKDENGQRICIRQVENLKGRDFQKVCSIHAEVNLIAKCAKYSISTEGMVLFLTNSPCYICTKAIIQSGIKGVYYLAEHTDTMGLELLRKNGVKVEHFDIKV